jgi:sugar (pentulose or hexulose) kinase
MSIVLGIDLGTTTITALAVDASSGDILACRTSPNQAEITAPADKARGRSEWDARRMAETACACVRGMAERLGEHRRELGGIGLTGQQHGVVLVDADLAPQTPFINWQDRRGEDVHPQAGKSYVGLASELAGPEAPRRAG